MGGGLRLAPGSGLNGVRGGVLEAIETARDQFVDGGRFVGRIRTFGSGLNCQGGLGGGPGLITWLGFRRLQSLVSAARTGATSRRHTRIWHSSTRLCCNGTAARKVFLATEIKRFLNRSGAIPPSIPPCADVAFLVPGVLDLELHWVSSPDAIFAGDVSIRKWGEFLPED